MSDALSILGAEEGLSLRETSDFSEEPALVAASELGTAVLEGRYWDAFRWLSSGLSEIEGLLTSPDAISWLPIRDFLSDQAGTAACLYADPSQFELMKQLAELEVPYRLSAVRRFERHAAIIQKLRSEMSTRAAISLDELIDSAINDRRRSASAISEVLRLVGLLRTAGELLGGDEVVRAAPATEVDRLPLARFPVPRRPGSPYARIVTAAWVPGNDVVVASSQRGAFAFMNRERALGISRQELNIITRAQGGTGSGRARGITRIRWQGHPAIDKSSLEPPPEAPRGWLEEVFAVLGIDDRAEQNAAGEVQDDSVCLADSQEREAFALEILDAMSGNGPEFLDLDPASIVAMPHGGDRVILKIGRDIVGRIFVHENVLTVSDERFRTGILRAVETKGLHPRIPLGDPGPLPQLRACLSRVSAWGGIFIINLLVKGVSGREGILAGFYFPAGEQLMVAADAWAKDLTLLVERHGLPVRGIVDAIPPGYEIATLGQSALSRELSEMPMFRRRALLAMIKRSSPSGGLTSPPNYERLVEKADGHNGDTGRNSPELEQLSPEVRSLIPDEVIDFSRSWIGPPTRVTKELRRYSMQPPDVWSPYLTDQQIRRIVEVTPSIELPPVAELVARQVEARFAPVQHLLEASILLREEAPDWWESLPSVPFDVPVRQVVAGDDIDIARASFRLGDLNDDEAEATGQPGLVRLFRDKDGCRDTSLPGDFSPTDRVRVYLGLSALVRAGVGIDSPRGRLAECVVCGRWFRADMRDSRLVEFHGWGQICSDCGWVAKTGYDRREPNEETATAAVRALVERHGVLPNRKALEARLHAATLTDLIIEVHLRAAIPRRDWFGLLSRAGLLDDGWRPSRGVVSTANDGHRTLSLFERYIDDWLDAQEIEHAVEPHYPYDKNLNPNGLRADWLIDGVFVEAAGMLSQNQYAQKIERKRALAREHRLELIIVTPEEIASLDRVFAQFLN